MTTQNSNIGTNTPFYPLFGDAASIRSPAPYIIDLIMDLEHEGLIGDVALEYEGCCDFLYIAIGASSLTNTKTNLNSFKSYRSEVNKFLNWSWFVKKQSITSMKRTDIVEFLEFCSEPPLHLIAKASHSLTLKDGTINSKWKPFVNRNGVEFIRKPKAIETQLSVLSSMYDHLIEEEFDTTNPAKQAKKRINLTGTPTNNEYNLISIDDVGKSFSVEQWNEIWSATEQLCEEDPEKHERTRFIMLMLYWLYLRISEISYRPGYIPYFGHIYEHPKKKGLWLFHIPNTKCGKKRTVGLPSPIIEGLIRYRRFRGLTDYPLPNEKVPIFNRIRVGNNGRDKGEIDVAISSDAIFNVVKEVYEKAAASFDSKEMYQDSQYLRNAVIHQLRHTGITHDLDLRKRSIESVSRDAGHSSTAVTKGYVNDDTLERYIDSADKVAIHKSSS
ncbi:hypothetical protein A1QO_00770 [Vibrio genomosp. F10 str. ZF-129]|uniref:Tyr recombinase domain-containing protein n=1 Tax=Vibrio genomosp. F10 str. ZF-129 TaxID=1187848 RepID=A0A1E5BHC1_9VIBR|nr:site-specific integrase [Vibrio genomosp. F10]OEE35325.1 hypothetical protein A1QO_00770 [Vibrio genomosp. F10 str. ZF-129]